MCFPYARKYGLSPFPPSFYMSFWQFGPIIETNKHLLHVFLSFLKIQKFSQVIKSSKSDFISVVFFRMWTLISS